MIYRCEYCKNRRDCPENKEQYIKTCDIIDTVIRGIDELPECHSYYNLTLKCDYWIEDYEAYVDYINNLPVWPKEEEDETNT